MKPRTSSSKRAQVSGGSAAIAFFSESMNSCSPAGKLIDSALKNAVRKASPAQWRGSGVSRSMRRRRTVRASLMTGSMRCRHGRRDWCTIAP